MKIEERTKKDRETELTESVDKEIHEHCGCGEHHHEHTHSHHEHGKTCGCEGHHHAHSHQNKENEDNKEKSISSHRKGRMQTYLLDNLG